MTTLVVTDFTLDANIWVGTAACCMHANHAYTIWFDKFMQLHTRDRMFEIITKHPDDLELALRNAGYCVARKSKVETPQLTLVPL